MMVSRHRTRHAPSPAPQKHTRSILDSVFMKKVSLYLCFGKIPLRAVQRAAPKRGRTVAAAQVRNHGGLR